MDIKITDVRSLPGDSAFLLDDGETSVLYDTGFAFTGYAVAENIRRILKDRPLDYIFLTHSHYDHALGSAYIRARYPGVKVVAGEYAARIFQKPTARARMRELDGKFAARCGVCPGYEDRIDELRVDIPVKNGDEISAGAMKFVAVELPGHTKCSVAYYLPSQKLLLSCETLGVFDGGEVVVPSCLVGCRLTLDSISRVREMDIETMLMPHHGLLSREQTAFFLSICRKSFVDTTEAIASILRSGGTRAQAEEHFINTFYRGSIPAIYPMDALILNTGIMVELIEKELVKKEC